MNSLYNKPRPCPKCGRQVKPGEQKLAPSLSLPEFPHFGPRGPQDSVRYKRMEKQYEEYLARNWWCSRCYEEEMKKLKKDFAEKGIFR